MQRVRFLVDFRGKLTKEQYFVAGQEAEFPEQIAAQLIAEGRAEAVHVSTDVDMDNTSRRRGQRRSSHEA